MQAVLHDVDGEVHLAVSPDDDPAAELQRNHGRFLYFSPDEVEPIEPGWTQAGRTTQALSRGGNEMISRLIKAALVAVVLAAIIQSLPDVKRYLELREM